MGAHDSFSESHATQSRFSADRFFSRTELQVDVASKGLMSLGPTVISGGPRERPRGLPTVVAIGTGTKQDETASASRGGAGGGATPVCCLSTRVLLSLVLHTLGPSSTTLCIIFKILNHFP